ncbi:MAG: succinate dehydrogenase assembly factor 2 [Pseudomonadota bacterium]|nr:succinate dehydrogenase assembly factor 2 [Pseudomonadota bacterium]
MTGEEEVELRRLRWRCRRGMRELDRLLDRYLEREWRIASQAQRDVFLRLLESEDDKLWHWFLDQDRPPDADLAQLVQHIRTLPP